MARYMESGRLGIRLVMRTGKELVKCGNGTLLAAYGPHDGGMELNWVPDKWLRGDMYVISGQIARKVTYEYTRTKLTALCAPVVRSGQVLAGGHLTPC